MEKIIRALSLTSIGICILALGNSGLAFASTVYDSTASMNGIGGWNVYENGNRITLGGTDRTITNFVFYYAVVSGGSNPFAKVRFLQNDGISGKPNTVLYDSGELAIPQGEGDFSYKISKLNITVPDTFTWSVDFGNHSDIGGEGWYMETPYLAFPRVTDAPKVGTWDSQWHVDYYTKEWQEDILPPDFLPPNGNIFAANIEATTAPIPSSIILIAPSLAGLAFVRRKIAA